MGEGGSVAAPLDRLRLAGHLARMWERRGAYRDLVAKVEGRKPLGRSSR
jgi:hypothetical protein